MIHLSNKDLINAIKRCNIRQKYNSYKLINEVQNISARFEYKCELIRRKVNI